MRGENRARNSESHAGPFAPAASALAAVKLLKDQRQIVGVDAGPIVFHVEIQTVIGSLAAERDARSGRRVAGHIFEQMAQNPAQQVRIEPGRLVAGSSPWSFVALAAHLAAT